MGKKDSGKTAEDVPDFDADLELFIQSMDFATVPGTNQAWWALFADHILTYAL